MTTKEENKIVQLRRQGYRLWRISELTKLPEHLVVRVLLANHLAIAATFRQTREL